MTETKEYTCTHCGKRATARDDKTPMCCGTAMTKLPEKLCLQPAHAEHARPMDKEDACDDGRAG